MSGMVTRSTSNCSNSTSETDHNDQDTVSVATSDDGSENNELAIVDDGLREKPSFGNIAVTNSSDIHFGNKTYYQGPVTIKQFLNTYPQISNSELRDDEIPAIKNDSLILDSVSCNNNVGKDNVGFVPDIIGTKTTNNYEKQIINVEQQHRHVEKGTSWIQNFSRQHLFLVISLTAVLAVSLVTLMSVLLTRQQSVINKPVTSLPNEYNQEEDNSPSNEYPLDSNLTLPGKFWIVPRKDWLAQPPKNPPTPLNLPVPYVIIMHTATENCTDETSCTFSMRLIQKFHTESRKWDDIAYSFLVAGDGNAYEGRGWKSVGAQVYGYNDKCIGIAFIGTFNNMLPPERQLNAARQLIKIGLEEGYIASDYKLLAARQLQTTQSPGFVLYEHIKTWPHWTATP